MITEPSVSTSNLTEVVPLGCADSSSELSLPATRMKSCRGHLGATAWDERIGNLDLRTTTRPSSEQPVYIGRDVASATLALRGTAGLRNMLQYIGNSERSR
ncbi:hypothetical protein CMUS01_14518 [Colletotrichum musicola]|uniref:Uncharacterized protein n=1 Tax=Colletotrichum musicola TaxID=2175873 RepID=A0A8H6J445_9PEZI|nr:hypothetical protein CMUS01_14518 [Colletotrichum musicola]